MRKILILLTMMICSHVSAQTGMHISALFEGKIVPKRQMVETRISGKAVSKYKLTFFHSVRFKADDDLVKRVDHLAAADFVANSEKFKQREPENSAMRKNEHGRKTFTQMYELAPQGNSHRFLCFKVVNDTMTVIYLEGWITSLDELKKIFND
ncbi:MAG: DUF6108 family protein [Prevotella sp.]|nr:DUF6108 family protein [Prevotella sp.]